MICLFSAENFKDFGSKTEWAGNGAVILCPLSCELEAEINGTWKITLEHPYDKEGRWTYLEKGAVIKAPAKIAREQTEEYQYFRIFGYERKFDRVTVTGFPICMESTFDAPVFYEKLENLSADAAINKVKGDVNTKYTIDSTVKSNGGTATWEKTNLQKCLASDEEGSFVSVWGGEVVYDNYTFRIRPALGDRDAKGHSIIYGKNMTDIDYDIDTSEAITRIYPVSSDNWYLVDDEDVPESKDAYIDSPMLKKFPFPMAAIREYDYKLIDTDEKSESPTADTGRNQQAFLKKMFETYTKQVVADMVKAGYPEEYLYDIENDKDDGIEATLSKNVFNGAIQTEDFIKFVQDCVKDGMEWMRKAKPAEIRFEKEEKTEPYTVYTNTHYKNQWLQISKRWYWMDANGKTTTSWIDDSKFKLLTGSKESGYRLWYGDKDDTTKYSKNCWVKDSKMWYWIGDDGYTDEQFFDLADYTKEDNTPEGSDTDWHKYWWGYKDDDSIYLKNVWIWDDRDNCYYHIGSDGYADNYTESSMNWYQDSTGWYYGTAAHGGTYITSQIMEINGTWYKFDASGYMLGVWATENEFSWYQDAKGWYYGDMSNHVWVKNQFLRLAENWCWFDKDGYFQGVWISDSDWGWHLDDKGWYYGDGLGYGCYVKNQWADTEDGWYWFKEDGYSRPAADSKKLAVQDFLSRMLVYIGTQVAGVGDKLVSTLRNALKAAAQAEFKAGIDLPAVTVSVDVENLASKKEYSQYKWMERLYLGDTVYCRSRPHGIESTGRVKSLKYDCIAKETTNVTIGDNIIKVEEEAQVTASNAISNAASPKAEEERVAPSNVGSSAAKFNRATSQRPLEKATRKNENLKEHVRPSVEAKPVDTDIVIWFGEFHFDDTITAIPLGDSSLTVQSFTDSVTVKQIEDIKPGGLSETISAIPLGDSSLTVTGITDRIYINRKLAHNDSWSTVHDTGSWQDVKDTYIW